MFNLKTNPVPDIDLSRMDALWSQYAKTQLNVGREFEEQHPELMTRTKAEEIHDWEDWAIANYSVPL